jgi:hypothetical protein
MSYIRHDAINTPVDPQPSYTEITIFSGTEGWTDITYKDWNTDYVAKNADNSVRTPGTYQARTVDNTPRTPAPYQRHDVNNNPVEI